jgi:2'-5' RNA ligase
MPKPASRESSERREKLSGQHYVEVRVSASEELIQLQKQLLLEYPFLKLTTPERLHMTLGYFGAKEELYAFAKECKLDKTRKMLSLEWEKLMKAMEYITDEPVKLYFGGKLAVVENSSLVLVLSEEQEFKEIKQIVYHAYLRMLARIGFTSDQAQEFIQRGKRTRYLDPAKSKLHVTIAQIPEGKSISVRKVPQLSLWATPSYLKRRLTA